ncbi:hypothetical protein KAR91_18005 [Candidatus Pacearchaeota archaeon]|nr:hypothetical protein [Candidatus Pacearchaeota archaeon]
MSAISKYSPSIEESERYRRIMVAIWAYAYEIEHDPLVSDEAFDSVCYEIDLTVNTGDKKLDTWFRKEFDPCTGCWIYSHPELDKVKSMYHRIKMYSHEKCK